MSETRFDLHVHSTYSRDCLMSLETIIQTVQVRKLSGIALTDHNGLQGARLLSEMAPFQVIVGEEIKTREGEIIGLFLCEEIPAHLSPEETVAEIHRQNGLVYVPHPTDRIRRSPLKRDALLRILAQVDILETLNSRVLLPTDNREAQLLALAHGIAQGAGSDAHSPREIGQAFVAIPAFEGRDGFLRGLRQGHVGGGISSPWVHLSSTWAKRYKKWASHRRDPHE